VLAAGVLLVGTTLSAILATAILDALIQRPAGGGSVTTIIPGFVYAAATVMKVCLVGGVVSAGVTLMVGVFGSHARPESALAADNSRLPRWGIASVALPAVTPLAGAITVVLVQQITSEVLSLRDFTYVSRTAVFVTLARGGPTIPAPLAWLASLRSLASSFAYHPPNVGLGVERLTAAFHYRRHGLQVGPERSQLDVFHLAVGLPRHLRKDVGAVFPLAFA
jgi:hypothetical protein